MDSIIDDQEYEDKEKGKKGRESCFDSISEAGYLPSSCDRED